MKQAGSSNYEYYIAMGEVTCERQAQCQKLSSSYERVISVAKPLAKYLGFEEPDGLLCQVLAPGVFMMQNENNENSDEKNSLVLVWDDDELKSFYEGLIDLKPLTSEIDADQGQKRQPPDPSTILHADSKSVSPAMNDTPSIPVVVLITHQKRVPPRRDLRWISSFPNFMKWLRLMT